MQQLRSRLADLNGRAALVGVSLQTTLLQSHSAKHSKTSTISTDLMGQCLLALSGHDDGFR
jgi:hypothetical protein